LSLDVNDPATIRRRYLVLGTSQARQGEYGAAVATFRKALALTGELTAGDRDLHSSLLIGLGESLASLEKYPEAEAAITRALASDRQRLGNDAPEIARDLEALGLSRSLAGQFGLARSLYERALAIRLRSQGVDHPRISEDLNELGNLAYLQRDTAAAESYWQRALKLDQTVLGPEHPDIAATLNSIARVMIERRGFAEARPLLERAVAINLAQRDDTHDDLAFTFANLGLALRGLNRTADAVVAFQRALRAAERHGHRNLAPVLTDLAESFCASRRFVEAEVLLNRAEPIMRADYPDDPWRSAWVESTRGECLIRAGETGRAAPLIRRSSATLLARWPKSSFHGSAAARRLRALSAGALSDQRGSRG
jgi:tetratricopeptide (TPR) repeat protein